VLGLPTALGLIGGTIDHAKRLIGLYRSAGRDAGHPDDQLTYSPTEPLCAGNRDGRPAGTHTPGVSPPAAG
jgi:hypothetical protein